MKPYVYYIFTYRLLLCAHRIRDFFFFSSLPLPFPVQMLLTRAHTSSILFSFFEILATIFSAFLLVCVCVVDIFSVVALESLFLSSTCCLAFSLGRKFNDTKWEKRKWDRFEYVDGHVFVFFFLVFFHYISCRCLLYVCICVYINVYVFMYSALAYLFSVFLIFMYLLYFVHKR